MAQNPSDWSRKERRVRRSSNPSEALGWWLESSRQRAKLRNLVLANDLGILVSGAGAAEEWDELAAFAPLSTDSPASRGHEPKLASVKLPGYPAYVCCSGLDSGAHGLLSEVAAGCARILESA